MKKKKISQNKKLKAYVIGVALGDGNLSNSNGRAVRLRVTCDKKYPLLLKHIKQSVQKMTPENKVSVIKRKGCFDISCYSNYWEEILGWKAKEGSKSKQKVSVPKWIKSNRTYAKECLRGLFQTDGSIYKDRKYLMVNFVTEIPTLAKDTFEMITKIGHKPNIQKLDTKKSQKFTIRISKDAEKFTKDIKLWKK